MDGVDKVVAAILSLKEDLDQRHGENITAQAVTEKKIVEAIRGIDELRKAFPDGDADGHRRYHESIIRKNEAREKFYEDLRAELAKKGLWAVIAVIATAMWFYVKSKLSS